MEAVEWSEILRWVPSKPQAAREQDLQRNDFGAGPPPAGQVEGGNCGAPAE